MSDAHNIAPANAKALPTALPRKNLRKKFPELRFYQRAKNDEAIVNTAFYESTNHCKKMKALEEIPLGRYQKWLNGDVIVPDTVLKIAAHGKSVTTTETP
jgi:hypothetical protein